MNTSGKERDLGFDLAIHQEAIEIMTKAGLGEASIDAILRARNAAIVDLPGSRLSVGIAEESAVPSPSDGTGVRVVCSGEEARDAFTVRLDVEKYFLRHFPGRTTANDLPSPPGKGAPCVYVVFRKAI